MQPNDEAQERFLLRLLVLELLHCHALLQAMWWQSIHIARTHALPKLPHCEAHLYLDRAPRRYPEGHALLSCLQQVAMSVFATPVLQTQGQIAAHD